MMLARHAESLFWAGRYIERAEDTARMLDVTYHGLLEVSVAETAPRWWRDVLVVHRLEHDFTARHGDAVDAATVSAYLVRDPDNPSAIATAVGRVRENAHRVRDLISTEVWEAVNQFHLELQARDLAADLDGQPSQLYGFVKRGCQTIAGVAIETMPRDEGWRFLNLGWMLERAEMMCRLLDVRYAQLRAAGPHDFHQWLLTLKSASASEAYRRAYRASMDPSDVVEFLLLSPTFPRSVLFCLRAAEHELSRLAPSTNGLTRPQRLIGRLRADLEFQDVSELLGGDVHRFLDDVQAEVGRVAGAVADQFFRDASTQQLHELAFHPPAGAGAETGTGAPPGRRGQGSV